MVPPLVLSQAAEFAAFQEELKKRQDAAAAADPKIFAQSYVDEKLLEQGNRHGKAVAVLRETHTRETQEMKNKHEAAIQEMKNKHATAVAERAARFLKMEEACARHAARNDMLKKDKADLEEGPTPYRGTCPARHITLCALLVDIAKYPVCVQSNTQCHLFAAVCCSST
eukprot:SAG22_NODE_1809_length_3528_cov_5.927676_3_plen_169_part_00